MNFFEASTEFVECVAVLFSADGVDALEFGDIEGMGIAFVEIDVVTPD